MKKIMPIAKLKERFRKIKTAWRDTDDFMCDALMFIAEHLSAIVKKPKRKATAWSLFAGKYMKEGKTIQAASKDWNDRKKR